MGAEGMTNKELMLKMFENSEKSAVEMAELKAEIKTITKTVEEHDKILKEMPEKITEKLEIKIEQQIKKSNDSDLAIIKRIEALEKKSGEAAIAAWKKIGVIVLTILLTSGVNFLLSCIVGAGK